MNEWKYMRKIARDFTDAELEGYIAKLNARLARGRYREVTENILAVCREEQNSRMPCIRQETMAKLADARRQAINNANYARTKLQKEDK